ncbi:glycosyltransferase family 2 protein [Endozoicomonas sp. SESOKO1]|uniref:glycosyltransferase family 2 protein n=1 Tax=Endozoicomonas sp. SESOKO1 TaxID=2828742 RepID=UPI00214857B0|nr:glycosyltransferase family 2 protein [Endozoicomonas sp. SESOKO1]
MITILTPTYNRVHTLPRLYQSLIDQTSYDFEWLVIDDGSCDSTEDLINGYVLCTPFQIRYIKKRNGGKHTALNVGFKNAGHEWLFIVDSDDWLQSDCISFITKQLQSDCFCDSGMSFLRRYENGTIIGERYDLTLTSLLERENKRIKGDKAEIYKTSFLKKFKFPEFYNEKFMAESPLFLWYGSRFSCKFYNYDGYICEYQKGGLSDLSIKNRYICAFSTSYVYQDQYEKFTGFVIKSRSAINWWRFRLPNKYSMEWRPPLLYLVGGGILHLLDRFRLGNSFFKKLVKTDIK